MDENIKQWLPIWLLTVDKATLPSESVWMMFHRRWVIEKKVFHDLKGHWGFGYNYDHDDIAFMAMRRITMIARNLLNLFYYRRMHCYYSENPTKWGQYYTVPTALYRSSGPQHAKPGHFAVDQAAVSSVTL